MFDIGTVSLLVAGAFGASLVGTVAGFGTGTISLPIVLLFYPINQSLIFTAFIHLFVDVWRVLLFPKGINKYIFVVFGLPAALGSMLGALLIFEIDRLLFLRLLGIFFLCYSFFIILQPRFCILQRWWYWICGGLVSGFSAGFFGVRGALKSVFLTAIDLPKEVYVATMGATALLIDFARLVVYLVEDHWLDATLLAAVALGVPFSFLGARLGRRILAKIPQEVFRYVIVAFLFVIGIKFLFFS